MLYSRTVEIAIAAMVTMALEPDREYVTVAELVMVDDLPPHFLAKVLQDLAREGLLRSARGVRGGFQLGADPDKIRLVQIVEALDCSVKYPAHMPPEVRQVIDRWLRDTTIGQLAKGARKSCRAKGRKPVDI